MKILPILFLVILLVMAMGCGSQDEPAPATSKSKSGAQVLNIPTSSIEDRLSKLEKQIIEIQKELGIGLQDYPVGSQEWWELSLSRQDKSTLEKRVTELEKELWD